MGGWRWASSAHLPHDTPCGSEPCATTTWQPCFTPASVKSPLQVRKPLQKLSLLLPGPGCRWFKRTIGGGPVVGGSGGKGPRCGEGRVALDLEKPGAARIYSYPAAGPRDGHPFRTLFSCQTFPWQWLLVDICGYCTNHFHKNWSCLIALIIHFGSIHNLNGWNRKCDILNKYWFK